MISDAILQLQYYGELCQFINFKKDNQIDTCGVTVNINGVEFIFNDTFIDGLTQNETNFVMLHEISHIIWDHQYRIRRGGYDQSLSNIAQDMIINKIIQTDIILKMTKINKKENKNIQFADIPINKNDNEIWVLMLPDEYKGNLIFEELYEWLFLQKSQYNNWLKTNINGNIQCPVSEYLKKIFEQLDIGKIEFFDHHFKDDVPYEYKKNIINDIKNILKNRGLLTDDVIKFIKKLTVSKKDYIKNIKIGINGLFGDFKNKTITKRNRRSIPGTKGKRKESYSLNVLLDVSGSMEGYLEKSLSYVFQNGIKINLIQCDTTVKKHNILKNKREFKKIEIKGYGGTTLQPGIDYISNDKTLNKLNTLILTDGVCDKLNVTKLKKCMIISHKIKPVVIGKVKQIIVN